VTSRASRSWLAAPLACVAACVCVRPQGSEYPARARLGSVTVVEEDCPESRGDAPQPADASAAGAEASARRFPAELVRRALATSTQPASREAYAGFARELNAFADASVSRGTATASPPGPVVQAIAPLGPGQVLFYPVVPAAATGADGARGAPGFESFLQSLTAERSDTASPCRVRVERNFVPEPLASPPARQTSEESATTDKPRAASDWAVNAVRLKPAFDLLAERRPGERPGHGIVLVHLDTGYTQNCQFWDAPHRYTPLRPEQGFDFFAGADDPADPMTPGSLGSRQPGHGTATGTVLSSPYDAGPLASCTPSQATDAVQGAAPGLTLVPARVSDGVVLGLPPGLALAFPRLDHRVAALAAGIYQASHGTGQLPRAHVLSISFGGADCDCPDEEREQRRKLETTLEEAEAQGLVVVAAAGQYTGVAAALRPAVFGGKHPVTFPGKWPSTIAASASDSEDKPWQDAGRGPEADVTAPGVGVWLGDTVPSASAGVANTDAVRTGDGTSFSTALVAGIAGLWLQHHGYEALHACYQGALASTYRWVLKHGGSRRPDGWKTDEFGPGIVDASAVLRTPLPSPAEVCADELPRRTPEAWARICGFTRARLPAACNPPGMSPAHTSR
jgi:Subtilase family